MTIQSEQAAIEVRIEWQHREVQHCNRQYFEKINFWRDILPGSLALGLPQSAGDWVSESFPAGELVPAYSEANIHRVRLGRLRLQRRHGPPIQLHAGRHYPRYIAAGTADIFPGNVDPLRILELDDDTACLDLNHPLARMALQVSARIVRRSGSGGERGGRCNDVVMDMLDAGAGLETLPAADSPPPFASDVLERLDPRPDALFYAKPRLVGHVDSRASACITEVYARLLQPGMQVLDLMSSWISHLPQSARGLEVTGLGMNAEELAGNPLLQERLVHDLNAQTVLPFADNRFDAIVCSLSVEYLTRPLAVMHELRRVLKPGAPAVMTFSDRWFPTKVVELWTELHPFERMGLVLEYFRRAGGFRELHSESMRGLPRPADDKYAGQLLHSDPVFAVWGFADK